MSLEATFSTDENPDQILVDLTSKDMAFAAQRLYEMVSEIGDLLPDKKIIVLSHVNGKHDEHIDFTKEALFLLDKNKRLDTFGLSKKFAELASDTTTKKKEKERRNNFLQFLNNIPHASIFQPELIEAQGDLHIDGNKIKGLYTNSGGPIAIGSESAEHVFRNILSAEINKKTNGVYFRDTPQQLIATAAKAIKGRDEVALRVFFYKQSSKLWENAIERAKPVSCLSFTDSAKPSLIIGVP